MIETSWLRGQWTPRHQTNRTRGESLGRIVAVSIALLAVAAGSPGSVAAAAPGQDGNTFFEKNIRPILVERCYECHSKQSKKIRGGLSLDLKDGWVKGGDLGPSIEPGKPDTSLLIQAVRYDDEDLKMPPKGKLSEREVALLTEWVAMGAPDPRSGDAPTPAKTQIDAESGRSFWAFRAPVDPPVPVVRNTAWPRTALDRFLLAALEEKGLQPAPAADKRTLIRRATFDLIGLPPTPAEIEAFLADESPDAFAQVVDRLLASPHYGERWGRHWLDVARYADSNGLDENVAYGNSWRYRDYVVQAFNQDKPFSQFLREQLAGDLLPAEGDEATTHERSIATGFLSLGPKVLAEVDGVKMEMDIVDEQVDTVGRAFMGLTIGCARCHDHKFDPIATTDYYALAGIFRSTKTMETFEKVARWYEIPLATAQDRARLAEHAKRVSDQKAVIDALTRRANEQLQAASGAGFVLPKAPEPLYPQATKDELKRLRDALSQLEKSAPVMPAAMGVTEGTVADVPVHIRGSHLSLGEKVARRVPTVLASSDAPKFSASQSGRLEFARWLTDPAHPLTSRVMVNRLWRWHFGKGLVATPDNFGALGGRPTNPLLLDWLAQRFVESGWSIKAMHRIIMLSSTYKMSAAFDPKGGEVDPENLLHWRFSPRRLEAEAIRDALLTVSGTLDPTMGGSLLNVENRGYFFDHTSKDATNYNVPRRSVYLPVVRNHMYDAFDLFDYSEAGVTNGDRATTTVAPQALFMMNSTLVEQAARSLASDLLAPKLASDGDRIGRLYVRAFGRPPEPAEVARAGAFLDRFAQGIAASVPDAPERVLRTWQALCQALLASNEFVYIE
ncbi:Planctomycete cytochrome C [Singulisphaera sp. GP187]|uniref:PSD1 and planctomycete cytochrome C domain-containing protein n=1 Tax=Singulisphaera sp. GP187 TaxID=1882752 RepID=UPI00092697FF|nr:PSD1 and planctomycete cytochrome C domain-containing protein [Singulisphaera sp. GP187]SIO61595.1 Planctomycete cytochrome C [Singulisphaera sp. GP187]